MSYSFFVDNNLQNPDFRIVDGQIALVRGASEIVQHIIISLETELAEWFLNVAFGIPYFTLTGNKNDNLDNGILGSNYDKSGYILSRQFDLINRRMGKFTVITSNLSIDQMKDPRIASRLIRDGNKGINCTGQDYAMRQFEEK